MPTITYSLRGYLSLIRPSPSVIYKTMVELKPKFESNLCINFNGLIVTVPFLLQLDISSQLAIKGKGKGIIYI